ncbi:MAG: low specificity L-threonine aldolase [Candidatus Aegiribacteria sp.]|nr:low specificity L-threonine aldolase [Candidatus Aegiribacteria sp.]
MNRIKVDLRSDTVSTPSHAMRNAMSRAEVGDDVFGEDPSINHLEDTVAGMAGFDRAVFMPTGTMSNGVAIRALTSAGDEVICGSRSHAYLYEGAQYAMLGGLQMHRIDENESGCIPSDALRTALNREKDPHFAPRTLVTLENTHNVMGGLILPQTMIKEIQSIASLNNASSYLDGARLWHVMAASGKSLTELVSGFRMVSMCFSKGLGCPVGSILLCSSEDEERVRFIRKQHGGGMRQAGILAAACIYALEHNLPVLSRTHQYAVKLARGIERSPVLELQRKKVDTNIVIAKTPEGKAEIVAESLATLEIGCLALSPSTVRFVTHLSLSERSVKYAADVLSAFGG